jgi:hypothetical protein
MKRPIQVSRDDYRKQIEIEAAYSQETKTVKLATRQKIKSSG